MEHNGWTSLNCEFRLNIIDSLKADVACIIETHLKDKSSLVVEGFTCFTNNREDQNSRARKGSGGVGVLIRDSVLCEYCVNQIDNKCDGILGVELKIRSLVM